MKKAIQFIFVFVLLFSMPIMVQTSNAENIPPYDYVSFIGEWHKIDPDGLNGDVPLLIAYVEDNNKITFSIDNGDLQTRTIDNNQVKWTESRYDGNIDLTLTFHDDYVHLQYSRYQEEWYPEITFVSDTCKPCKITAGDYSVVLNGMKLDFDQPPIIASDRVLVPLRKIFEELGAAVDYVSQTDTTPGHYNAKEIYIRAKSSSTELYLERPWFLNWQYSIHSNGNYIDGATLVYEAGDALPIIINDRTLVPVRFVSEIFGANVNWDAETQTVIINTDNINNNSNEISEKEAEQIAIKHYIHTGCEAATCYLEDDDDYYVRVFMTYNEELHQYSFVVGECKVNKYTQEVQEI